MSALVKTGPWQWPVAVGNRLERRGKELGMLTANKHGLQAEGKSCAAQADNFLHPDLLALTAMF